MLTSLHAFLQEEGWHVGSLIFDGLAVMLRSDAAITEDVLKRASARIKKETGFSIKLATKPFKKYE